MTMTLREATVKDLDRMLELLNQIDLIDINGVRKKASFEASRDIYSKVLTEIQTDPNNEVLVGLVGGEIVAMIQMTYIPGLFFGTNLRAMAEDVRIAEGMRGQGLGKQLMTLVFERAKQRGCKIFQLTTNDWRTDPIAFYKKLGMKHTHVGLRINL